MRSNYELFKPQHTLIYAIGQKQGLRGLLALGLPAMIIAKGFRVYSFSITGYQKSPVIVFFVTTSPFRSGNIADKIKYETSPSSADGSRLTTSRAHIAAGATETTRLEKDDKRVELATRTHYSQPTRSRCYDHKYASHIPTEINSAMERHGTGAGPLAEKLRR
ncbi:hypothetical protein JTE90_018823 [Oedothorax gibbosus]|uniref:Uncharacterized protein n=1 Tax=Oedothorax gibbosus TaxID=931172 RepID=A0AAV6TFF0_9ARAC|nr:hypothetical protein JTE90_018823 [Oedothorax gibbosus]